MPAALKIPDPTPGLPPGAATEATSQEIEQELDDLNAQVSTAAKQDTGNASLASIDSKLTSPITVTGPLTDTQLRASAVPVSGPLTDTQLRATPVPVSGTVTANAGTGTFLIDNAVGQSVAVDDNGGSLTVDGTVSLSTSSTGTRTDIARSNANQTFLSANASRKGASVFNDAAANLFIKCGATASTTDFLVRLQSQDYFEVPFNYTGRIDGIWASNGAGSARVTEFT